MSEDKCVRQRQVPMMITERWDYLHSELYAAAKDLAQECHDLLASETKEVKWLCGKVFGAVEAAIHRT